MPQSYLEKYGILHLPEAGPAEGVSLEENALVLPDSRRIAFEVRPEEDDRFWREEMAYQLRKFSDTIPMKVKIEGRPGDERLEAGEEADGWDSDRKFGISFFLDEDECFYGLGEAKRDGIQLRGGSYQNWAVYQFDEIVIPLVISSRNWGLFLCVQDRHFVDIDDHAKGRLTVLGNRDELDLIVLYGDSMKDIVRGYTQLTGKSMLLPRWAYGLTYVALIHQNQFEILNDLMKFREKHIPCDNVSLEPGWMAKFYDYSFEKKWNLEKFHMDSWMRSREYPCTFPSVLRRFGFHMALWLCMNYDLCDHEEGLAGGESRLRSWYDHVKPFVDDGADGFKLDPADMLMRIDSNRVCTNGETELAMHNISQVLVMKQMHEGFAEQMNRRPFIHYCGGYSGQQHWGAATTGDNGGLLGGMVWMQNLAMSGFMNTTVDMDIYCPEAIHFAMLAPWAHHNAWQGCSQPWYAGEENEKIYTDYARLRYRLLPYIYSAAIECSETGIPMISPMPLAFQEDMECRELANQYMLGEFILLSAFTDRLYLPEGKWIDYWTGEEYTGPYLIDSYTPPEGKGGAMLIKKGAVIPQWRDRDYTTQYSDEEIALHFYPGGDTEYLFREDDGMSLDYRTQVSCRTLIRCQEREGNVLVSIGRREGGYENKPEKRVWKIFVHGYDGQVQTECEEEGTQVILENG